MKNVSKWMVVGAVMAAFCLANLASGAERPNVAERPNIVLIIADDLGYGETGMQGCDEIPTPHADSIAANGVRFTNGYVTAPMCHPSRAGLMTGRYQMRFGIEGNPPVSQRRAGGNYGVPATEPMLSERLKTLGYATGLVGKWHLGRKHELTPLRRGFDEFYGIHHGAHGYFPDSPKRNKGPLMRGDEEITEPGYLTTAFGREAVAFVDRHRNAPFFLCLSFTAVHEPMEATESDLGRFPDMKAGKRKIHAAMTASMDDAIGSVLKALKKHGIEEDTLIFFISDNGGFGKIASSNKPLRGAKWTLWEGGNRVPFAVQWKGHIPAGTTYDQPVSALDILPTSVVAAGGTIDPAWKLDGVDLVPYLNGSSTGRPHATLYWRIGERQAVRNGDWKMILDNGMSGPGLFDLARDVSEKKDLATEHPEKLAALTALYEAWAKELPPPQVNTKHGRLKRVRKAK